MRETHSPHCPSKRNPGGVPSQLARAMPAEDETTARKSTTGAASVSQELKKPTPCPERVFRLPDENRIAPVDTTEGIKPFKLSCDELRGRVRE